ncbi:MAG: hypothetical protein AAGL90_16765 [Pseudomonadota bacterium]
MWAEFKEKPYETAFVGELRLLTNAIYAPDQCDESFLGFDASAFIPWEDLWPISPHMRWRRWRNLGGVSASEIDDFGKNLNRRLPPFRLNFFVQFKRPQYLTSGNSKEWSTWDQNYFRYAAPTKQQMLLRKIIDKGAGRAIVVYAAAAFHSNQELFTHQANDAIIDNSNIASAAMLDGHTRFSYAQAGNFGVGHSEPENLSSPTLQELLTGDDDSTPRPFTQHIKATAKLINTVVEDDDERRNTLDLARQAILGGSIEDVYPRAASSWFDAAVTMVAFSAAFDVRVCAID